ncbi:MAG: hypothetical protein CSA25_04490 [Desulfobacter postgatei]|uniref:Nickel/cobalt efflux system n=1 Tax=Desulfobacter postgatei TaxID=2293 RepID=A0A2G6MRD0_9BACT|nr:MAG: hypothetical protein CSA25_04490 [Desulfobacter postgatei]
MRSDVSYFATPHRPFFKGFLPIFFIMAGIAWGLCFTAPVTAQATPFTRKKTTDVPQHQDDALAPAPTVAKVPVPDSGTTGNTVMTRITHLQMKIKEKMTALIRQAKTTGEIGPLLWVLAAAFIYGMVHAAGPGHGKALALSYIVSIQPTRSKALAFGNLLAISHGMSGAALIFCVKFLLQASISGTLASVTRTTQIASYLMIIALGLFLFLCKLPVWKNSKPAKASSGESPGATMDAQSILAGVVIGMIPCSGVVLAVLFCLSLGLPGLGMMLACAITLGMASTLSVVVLTAMAGKAALLAPLPRRFSFADNAGDLLEALAGLILCTMSLMLLLSVFNP